MRLGHKYQIDHLVEQALAYLRTVFPNKLKRWREAVAEMSGPREQEIFRYSLPFPDECAIGVVNIARLTGCASILPGALLICCTLHEELVHGFEREDGTREMLSEDDFMRCLLAKPRLMVAAVQTLFHAFQPLYMRFPPEHCSSTRGCNEGLQTLFHCLGRKPFVVATPDPFWDWDDYVAVHDPYWEDICRSCRNCLKRRFFASQQELWSDLPNIFNIEVEGWEKPFVKTYVREDVREIRSFLPSIPELTDLRRSRKKGTESRTSVGKF